MYKPYRNLVIFFLTCLVLLIAVFNVFIDPFMVFGSPLVEGVNKNKPFFDKYQRLVKAYTVRHARPHALILGSSRVEQGLDPNHPAFSGRVTYNAGINGISIRELKRYFEHAVVMGKPKIIVLGLDFFAFNSRISSPRGYADGRLASQSNRMPVYLADYVAATLTGQAFISSKETLGYQGMPQIYRSGFAEPVFQHTRNHRDVFIWAERTMIDKVLFRGKPQEYRFDSERDNSFDYYRQIIDLAHRENIGLYLFISPLHARIQEVIGTTGLWPAFEEWKQSLVRINRAQALIHSTSEFPLWDFSGYNRVTTESVPQVNEKEKRMQWYSEGSHYRAVTGDLVLNKLFGIEDKVQSELSDFGTIITVDNIESHLKSVREARAEYRASHATDVAEVKSSAHALGFIALEVF